MASLQEQAFSVTVLQEALLAEVPERVAGALVLEVQVLALGETLLSEPAEGPMLPVVPSGAGERSPPARSDASE